MGPFRGLMAAAPLLCVLTLMPDGEVRFDPAGPVAGGAALLTPSGSPVTRAPRLEAEGPATPTAYGDCGPGARPETGLQGQVPIADQRSGRAKDGYRCNVRRVARDAIGLRGQNFQLAWYRDCAYVSTIGVQAITGALGEPQPELDGIGVVDVADALDPKLAGIVKSPVAKSSHEALEVNEERGLLVTTQGGLVAQYVEVYDVAQDCRKPRFLGRYDAGIPIFHGLRVANDGRTVYATDTFQISGAGQILHAIDISDPRHPRRLLTWDPLPADQFGSHDLEIDATGDRLYLGTAPYQALKGVVIAGEPSVGPGTSLAIMDSSEVQDRRPGGDLRTVSRLTLPNIGHTVQRMTIGGRPYLLVSGEEPVGGPQNCPWAWGHIVDISDERRPRRVSDLRLEVNDSRNCPSTSRDEGAIYSIHYAGVDDERETSLVFYTYYTGGLRVFDVRDPANPREIGYYNPPPTPGTTFPALSRHTPDSGSATLDYTTSVVRYQPETGAIWLVSVNGGFQVLQLTGSAARQDARVVVRRRRGRTLPVHLSCAQPCRTTLRAGRSSRTVELARGASTTIRLRAPRGRPARVTATVHDRLTGERQTTVRARERRA